MEIQTVVQSVDQPVGCLAALTAGWTVERLVMQLVDESVVMKVDQSVELMALPTDTESAVKLDDLMGD